MKKTIFTEEHHQLIARLKVARAEAMLDQNAVAKALGRTQSYISKIEAGQRRIDMIQIKEFAKIYKKPFSYFLPQ